MFRTIILSSLSFENSIKSKGAHMDYGESSYRRFLEGDQDAFREVFELYRDGLTYFINSYVRNEADAEDLAEDCFVELLLNPKRYNFSSSLKTYLYTIGKNKAINYLKRSLRSRPSGHGTDFEEFITLIAGSFDSAENTFINNNSKSELRKELLKLKDDYRTALYLVYFENASYKEAGMIMKKSEKQIEKLLYKGKKALKIALQA